MAIVSTPGDGTGEYDSEGWCLSECISVIPSYDCVNGDCIDPGDGSGQYQSL